MLFFVFFVWNSFIALLNLFVIAILTIRRENNLTIILIVVQCLMRNKLSYHTNRCITMPTILVISSRSRQIHPHKWRSITFTTTLSNGTVHGTHLTNCTRGRRGSDRMVAGFIITFAISAYHKWCCEFQSRSGWRVKRHVPIKLVITPL